MSSENSVAVLELVGPLVKGDAWCGTSTGEIRGRLRRAVEDPAVKAILLHVDSPGGMAAGTGDLADEVAAAARVKPVVGYIEDLCASAAYWIASQATRLFANPTAIVGSIGTYGVAVDSSRAAAGMGVVVHIIRAGEFKGAGEPGTEITAEQLAEFQQVVDAVNSHFLAAVARGRRMSPATVEAIADGRVLVGDQAEAAGLIDGIQTLEEVVTQLSQGTLRMATIQQLRAACPDAPASFLLRCIERNISPEKAQDEWIQELATENRRLRGKKKPARDEEEGEEAEEEEDEDEDDEDGSRKPKAAARRRHTRPGVKSPLPTRTGGRGGSADPVSAFNEEVQRYLEMGKGRREAVRLATRVNPALHEEYLRATNPDSPAVQNAISDRFGGR
jgi:signal peptide peptidase SppA